MRERLPAAVLAVIVLLACLGTPAPASTAQPARQSDADPVSALQRRVSDLLADPAVSAGTWGIDIRSLVTNESLASVNRTRLLTPASTLKLVTLAVAADQLGWDYTYETQVRVAGTIHNGTLAGDLVIIGAGDPSLDDWDGAGTAVFRAWADELRELGVTTVTGRIIGDGHAFSDDGLGAGWAWDDLAFSYSAVASALQFNQNAAQVRVLPAETAGAPALVTLTPPYAPVALEAQVSTGAPHRPTVLVLRPRPEAGALAVTGSVPLGAGLLSRTFAVPNPALYYALAVRDGLRGAGIDVRGDAVDVSSLREPPAIDADTAVITYRSPALASLANTMMKLSQNLYAETLLRTVGLARAGIGTADAGRAIGRSVLDRWGVAPGAMLIVDGSGLSRYNLVTPDAMVTVLAHVYQDPRLRDPFIASLPVAGRSGTLGPRMRGTPAEGRVQAKTGSFSNARAVAGFGRTGDGEPVAFSIMANNYGVSADAIDRITDAIIVATTEFRRAAVHPDAR